MQVRSGLKSDSAPPPSAIAGATIHDSTAIGMAAAAQIANTPRREYWVTVTAGASGVASTGGARVVVTTSHPFLGGELERSTSVGRVVRVMSQP